MRELVAEAEADNDVMLRVTVLFMLPHVLAYQGDEAGARAAADAAIESSADLGDLYIGSSYVASSIAYLAAGDIAGASDAEATAWSHLSRIASWPPINLPTPAAISPRARR